MKSRPGYLILAFALLLVISPAIADTIHRLQGSDAWRDELILMEPHDVGAWMVEGKKVVFVDVREEAEYEEFHVPGAVSLPLRHIDDSNMGEFADADLVIPYCLKDFRGFEGAKKLKEKGIENVGLVEGFGINSWKRAELPVAGGNVNMSDEEALRALAETLDLPVVEP